MRILPAITLCLLLTACAGYKTPGLDQAPHEMSADTLCFRYASSKDPALAAEIDARNLDCAALLRDDPMMPGGPGLDAAHRISR